MREGEGMRGLTITRKRCNGPDRPNVTACDWVSTTIRSKSEGRGVFLLTLFPEIDAPMKSYLLTIKTVDVELLFD